MSYNEGAQIVPLFDVKFALLADPRAAKAKVPDNYARFQLLAEEGYHKIVFEGYDHVSIQYGADSPDFPLCEDFSAICKADVLRAAIKDGLAVRPAFFQLDYTKKSGARHSINAAVLAFGGGIIYYEPQTDEWLSEPVDCLTMDEFRA